MKIRSKSPDKGFTLVEIMIVVVIIGLLAAMAIPAFNKVRYASRQKAVTNNLRQVAAAAQEYLLEQGASQVDETQLEGTGSSNYIRPIARVNGETYSGLAVTGATTQISTSQSDGTVVTFNM
jgi:type IV pilus assembly protein PilA